MKNTKKNIARIIAMSTVSVAMAAAVLPVNAETKNSDVTKKEDVFVVLNPDGSVNKTTVSDTLHSDSGFSNYDDKSSLTDAQNLKSTDDLTKSSDGYVWNTSDQDIYYQGTATGSLPLDIAISYQLDGKDITEEDLLGKSGHVTITLSMTNKKYQYYTVNGKTYKIALPMAAVAGAVMKKDIFSNITINTGSVTSDSSHDIATAVTLPGMKDSLNGVLTAQALDKINTYLNDEIVIEADAEEYEAPEVMLAASTNISDLKTELGDTDLSAVWSDLDKLQSATDELLTGTQSLYDGATQLSDGASQLQDGASQLADGAASLSTGADQVSAGAASLEAGLSQLSGNSEALNNGADQVEASIIASANEKLNAALKKANANAPTVELTSSNYADVFASLLEINDSERQTARINIKAAVEAKAGNALDNYIDAIIYMASINSTGNFNTDVAIQAARIGTASTVNTYSSSFKSENDCLIADQASPKKTTVNNILTVLDDMTVASGNKVSSYMEQVMYGRVSSGIVTKLKAALPGETDVEYQATAAAMIAYTADINAKAQNLNATTFTSSTAFDQATTDFMAAPKVLQEINDSATESGKQKILSTLNVLVATSTDYQSTKATLAEYQSQLDSLEAFVKGIKAYTAGVDSAYAGSQTLAAGASQVADGAASLSEGASKLKSGLDTLSTGIDTLTAGAKTLMDGMTQYNTDGISKLTGSTDVADLKNADALLKQIKQNGEDYNNYSGISDGTTGTVKFVYKVKTIKTEKDSTVSTASTDVTHTNDGLNVWQRIINLFVFWK